MIHAQPVISHSNGRWLSQYGFETFLMIYGLWVFLLFLAPVFMHIGWDGAGTIDWFGDITVTL